MKRDKPIILPAVGGSSLLVIFAVLCLCVFAMLALCTAKAERQLSDVGQEAVNAYYAADMEAEKVYALLRSGQTVPGVIQEGEKYRYACVISETQVLLVEVEKTEDGWQILRWQTEARTEAIDEMLPVWDGS